MKSNRRNFIEKACLTSACFCGFNSFAVDASTSRCSSARGEPDDRNLKFMQDWISNLLLNVDKNSDREGCRKIMKPCSAAHYNFLEMDNMLIPYEGDIRKFIQFIGEQWGWKIDYNADTNTIIADENKNDCVCPMVNKEKGISSAICYCSEGFAERMFSKVIGCEVKATVVSSIHRGDKSCRYKIEWPKN